MYWHNNYAYLRFFSAFCSIIFFVLPSMKEHFVCSSDPSSSAGTLLFYVVSQGKLVLDEETD